jgi:hypothetical protein
MYEKAELSVFKYDALNAYRDVREWLHIFLISAVVRGECPPSLSSRLTPVEITRVSH